MYSCRLSVWATVKRFLLQSMTIRLTWNSNSLSFGFWMKVAIVVVVLRKQSPMNSKRS